MGSSLKDNLANRYYQRRNLLNSRPNLIKALVENSSDIAIWKHILEKACPSKDFDVVPYQMGDNRAESKQLVIKTIKEKGGPLYIGCVDADQDKALEQVKYPNEGLFYPANYLFHTYVYSVEDLLCMPETLSDVYVSATSFLGRFDYVKFFKLLSNTIYPLVITDLYIRFKKKKGLKVDDWSHVFPGDDLIKKNILETSKIDLIEATERNVSKYLKSLQQCDSYNSTEFTEYQTNLEKSLPEMNADNCVLFVYGHELFRFVESLMDIQRNVEIDDKKYIIYQDKAMDQNVKAQKIAELKNLQFDIRTVLRTNFKFIYNENPIYQKIKTDIKMALGC